MAKYSSDGEAKAAAEAKHGSREAYETHIKRLAHDKFEAERAKKGPRAPSIEEITQALVAATASLRAGDAVAAETLASVEVAGSWWPTHTALATREDTAFKPEI